MILQCYLSNISFIKNNTLQRDTLDIGVSLQKQYCSVFSNLDLNESISIHESNHECTLCDILFGVPYIRVAIIKIIKNSTARSGLSPAKGLNEYQSFFLSNILRRSLYAGCIPDLFLFQLITSIL